MGAAAAAATVAAVVAAAAAVVVREGLKKGSRRDALARAIDDDTRSSIKASAQKAAAATQWTHWAPEETDYRGVKGRCLK
jgi:hypothetical protein